jgi:alkylresorcinol/alkylpyrone synthase
LEHAVATQLSPTRTAPLRVADPVIAGIGTALPPHHYDQEELLAGLRRVWAREHYNDERLGRLHESVQVAGRCLALPIEEYESLGFGAANSAFIRVAGELSRQASLRAFERAGVGASDIDAVFFTTVTGVATPSIDAQLANSLRLRSDVKRVPMFGLGCVGGAAGLARVDDYLRGFPDHCALLVCAELCSLTLQRDDLSVANLIATGLFGDGVAALVASGPGGARSPEPTRRPHIVANASVFYRDTEWVMGWDIGDSGFKVVLSGALPDVIRAHVAEDVDGFLAARGLTRRDIDHWICHPGGPKIMATLEEALELPAEALRHSWSLLAEVGNLSSASVLFVLERALGDARSGDIGLVMAMGPGFCTELVLVRWS